LSAVLSTDTFDALALAERAPFDPPTTIGQVIDVWRSGRLGLTGTLGPRRLAEIQAAPVVTGPVLADPVRTGVLGDGNGRTAGTEIAWQGPEPEPSMPRALSSNTTREDEVNDHDADRCRIDR
jgi:hypothetical protein